MSEHTPAIEPIRSGYRLRFLSGEQLDQLQEATLRIMEEIGVRFPSDKALAILADHGAHIDRATQIVKIPRDLVSRALATLPRYFHMGARDPAFDLHLEDGATC